jgi:hypothetical protein
MKQQFFFCMPQIQNFTAERKDRITALQHVMLLHNCRSKQIYFVWAKRFDGMSACNPAGPLKQESQYDELCGLKQNSVK